MVEALRRPASFSSIEEIVFHASSDGVLVLSNSTRAISAVNSSLCSMTGHDEEDLLGEHVELLWPDDALHRDRWDRVMSNPGLYEDVPVRCADGGVLTAEVKVCPAELDRAGVTVCFFRDLTARRELERELIEGHIALKMAYDSLEQTKGRLAQAEKMATVGRFAAGVAHEINNPAAFVLANVLHLHGMTPGIIRLAERHGRLTEAAPGTLSAEEVEEDSSTAMEVATNLEELVSDTVEGVRRIRSISKQLRTFSHTANGQVTMVDVNEVIHTSLRLLGKGLMFRGRVIKDLDPALPSIPCRDGSLEQVLTNLLANACQAMSDKDPEGARLDVSTSVDDQAVRICVKDTGPGIPKELLGKVFDPFFTTKRQGEGTGLGLALSQEIAAQHGGRIEASSVVGNGTTMTVVLPFETGLTAVQPRMSEPPGRFVGDRPIRALVIDDEIHLLRSLKRVLSSRCDVTTANGGNQALEILERDAEFDVVLVDMIMPDVDGCAVYEYLRTHHPELRARTVFMTGGTYGDVIRQLPGASSNVMLQKPFDNKQLVKVVEQVGRG